MDKVNKSLRLFSDTLEEWVECQKKWLYLENIFMAPDIQRQLPNETKLFASVDRQFKSIMRTTRDRPAALPVSLHLLSGSLVFCVIDILSAMLYLSLNASENPIKCCRSGINACKPLGGQSHHQHCCCCLLCDMA